MLSHRGELGKQAWVVLRLRPLTTHRNVFCNILDVRMTEKDDPLQLRLWYWELHKKQQNNTFEQEDVFYLIYVCNTLGRLGYILNDDESDWILLPDTTKNDE